MKRLVFIFSLLVALSFSVTASAAFRVARVPIIVSSLMTPTDEVLIGLERQIDQATHVPLNGTLGAVEYLDETECGRIYAAILAGQYGKILKREAPEKLAELMDADLVIVPELTGYEEYVRPSWHWDRREILHSYAAVRIAGYDRMIAKPFRESVTRTYDDEYSLSGQVERLARDAMTMVLDEARVHDRVWQWKEKAKNTSIADSTAAINTDTTTKGTDDKDGN